MVDKIISMIRMNHVGDTRSNDNTNVSEKVNEQVQLGHNAFFAGVWTTKWCRDQTQFYESIGSKRDPNKWMSYIITQVQRIPILMWNKRNSLRTASLQRQEVELKHKTLDTEIDNIFDKKPHGRLMAHCDNSFLKKYGKEQVEKMTLYQKTNWVEGARLILAQYERVDAPQAARFTAYFQWDRG
jgi:hypothetical protein